MFKSTTGLCTPSALTNETQPFPTSEEGDLFQSFHCNTSTGFSAAIYGDTVVCVALFGPANYAEAGADCQDKGAYLASVKTSDKYSFLSQVAGNHNVWVGCDDLLQEGTFVWREDGQEVTLIERTNVFDPSDPATDDDLEDCISFQPSHSGLRDDDCSLSQSYVCEMPYG
ncbi:unnamed protein product [Candidula unifasciata]|uniref:C-type lectin domain-containing protein n=1 Tax=Candidula unifasciata TaxID=100452 RepID=A0A8S3ZIP4_9EUPU|nr:unnamed protein product [Candidula unifasciata]